MNIAFKRLKNFAVTQSEDNLIEEIRKHGVTNIEILRRGIVSYCTELKIEIKPGLRQD